MAINLNTNATIAGRVTPVDLDYPYASSKNETTPGARDGTPWFKARSDDIFGLMQGLLRLGGIVPTGNADTARNSQYIQAIEEIASGRAVNYDESGVVNAYVLDLRANQHGTASYFDGMIIEFTPTTANTGASTVNVNSLGVRNIKNAAGLDVSADSISGRVACRFDSLNNRFILIKGRAIDVSDWVGISYTDPDAVGANATARIYPDGTIVGSTDNGEYIKYPNGTAECFNYWNFGSVAITTAHGNIFISENQSRGTLPLNLLSIDSYSQDYAGGGSQAWILGNNLPTLTAWGQFFFLSAVSTTLATSTVSLAISGKWK